MALASAPDEEKSSLDILAEGSINDQLDDEKVEETAAPAVDEREAKYNERFDKLEQRLLEKDQELQFMRGFIANQQKPPPVEQKEPVEAEPDYEALTKDIETRGSKALHEFVEARVAKGVEKALKLADGKIANVRQADRAEGARRTAFQNELNRVSSEFADFWKDESFKKEADAEAADLLRTRLGRDPNPDGSDVRFFQPGDLLAAVKAAAYARSLKAPPPSTNGSSIREIIRRVPASDDLGNRNGGARRTNPKTFDELDMPDKERNVAKNIFKKLKALNPGMSEETGVKYYIDGQRDEER